MRSAAASPSTTGRGAIWGGAAKRELQASQGTIDPEMREVVRNFAAAVGIVGNTEKTPLDGGGRVYKNLDVPWSPVCTRR